MATSIDQFLALPTPVTIIIGALVVVQVALAVWALVLLYRWPHGRVAGANKLVWTLIIVLGEIFGSLVFFFFLARDRRDAARRAEWEASREEQAEREASWETQAEWSDHGHAPEGSDSIVEDLYGC